MTPSTLVHRDLGLTDAEYESIRSILERDPTYTELAMFSVMWSEHCSYKSSRVHLKKLPSTGPHILVGPGEGAGIIEIAPGVAVAWKAESHNHPSFVEPVNGAATGVGGIVRDILSMGARPIALLDSLRFGDPVRGQGSARTRYVAEGVVSGISGYGNSIGVPTVGGETVFDQCYAENPLVNVACLGVIEDRVMQGRADGVGNHVVLIGSSTGRDGIGGASVLASATFDEDSLEKRPSVQVGDPFSEKLLIESCLELVGRGLLVGLQDLGAGGIACPSSEMAAKAGTGMRVYVDRVHRREPVMEPFEVMISESQERMMAVVAPDHLDEVLDVCRRWELDAAVIGEVIEGSRLEIVDGGEVVADVPVRALAEDGPVYERPSARPSWLDDLQRAPSGGARPPDLEEALLALLTSPSLASKRWIWQQYDHMIFLGTIAGPGGDAALVRLPGRREAVAITVDGPGRYCFLDPYEGARLAVSEAYRNVAVTGARPLAITNCLNFGDPERPDVMWQFEEVIRGIADACSELETPVTGGNVSFYNETTGRPIYPTPVIGMLGAIDDVERSVSFGLGSEGDAIVLLGRSDPADFGGSELSFVVEGVIGGRPPAADLPGEKALAETIMGAAARSLLTGAHDVASGGVAVALCEAAFASEAGFILETGAIDHPFLFCESPARAIVSCAPSNLRAVTELATANGVAFRVLGRTGGTVLDFGRFQVPLDMTRSAFERAVPDALSVRVE
ncbi:MAG: phosphoribosylformylglycinamidine synthase subunit PurL [Actinomycetota bacterium]|nr:phosphoribosylformylglycinamidine synthase subunit PurL [Actinomycetota bacterium]